MAEPDNNKRNDNKTDDKPDDDNEDLKEVEAFDLVTEGLLSLDAYKRTRARDKSHLSEAQEKLDEALEKLKETKQEPLYSRAKYFSLMIEYLKGSQQVAHEFDKLTPLPTNLNEWSAYEAEVVYNAGAAYYSQRMYVDSTDYFRDARNAPAASREVRLLAGAGLGLSLAKQATNLSTEKQQVAWELKQQVHELDRELRWERFKNFLRLLWAVPHVELALTRKARKLINQAKDEVKHISRPTNTPTAQTGGLTKAT